MINLSVKLTQKRLDLEDQIIYIPQASFDVKLLMVANRKWLKVTHWKKVQMILAPYPRIYTSWTIVWEERENHNRYINVWFEH